MTKNLLMEYQPDFGIKNQLRLKVADLLTRAGLKKTRKLIFLGCLPKSGSTWFLRILTELTGYARLMPATNKSAEQDLCPHSLRATRHIDGIVQQHARATQHNIACLLQFNIRPVIHVRNIFDVIPSLVDHFNNESRLMCTGWVPKEFESWSRDTQVSFVSRNHSKWILGYLKSWDEAYSEKKVPIVWTTYEGLVEDTVNTVMKATENSDLLLPGQKK